MQFVWLIPSLVMGAVLGVTSGSWQILVLAAVTLIIVPFASRLRRRRDFDLSGPVEVTDRLVFIGDNQLPRWPIFWRQEWHDALYRKLKPELDARLAVSRLSGSTAWLSPMESSLVVGATDSGAIVSVSLQGSNAHLLILGATGTGKSKLMQQLVEQICASKPSSMENCDLWLLDFKGGSALARFSQHPRAKRFVTDIDGHDAEALWRDIEDALTRREQEVAAGVILSSELFLVVDEFAEALRRSSFAQPALASVLARGRSLGIHLIAASQGIQGVSQAMLTNFGVRILLGRADAIQQMQIGVKPEGEYSEPPPGWLSGQLAQASNVSKRFIFPATHLP